MRDAVKHVARIVEENERVKVTRTSYTITVETERRKYFFADSGTAPHTFGVNKLIEKDIAERAPDLWTEHADPREVTYFRVPKARTFPDACYCVDIKAAYPSTLRLLDMVSVKTHRACMSLPKADRLKAVGMLASRQFVQEYLRSELVATRTRDNPFRPWFFDVCHYVGDVMREASEAAGDGFHLFWVDGAFVSDPAPVAKVLQSVGYTVSVERVEGIRRSSDGSVVRYRKGGKETYLCLPVSRKVDARDINREIIKLRTQC